MTVRAFRDAARAQRVCALTGRAGAHHAHHVVREQDVLTGDPHDPRNALRLSTTVHLDHHGIHKLPLSALTDNNIEFAYEILGSYAADYLHRRYSGDDPRITVNGWEPRK